MSLNLDQGEVDSSVVSTVSSNKTDRHDITEILLKVALNTIKQTNTIEYRVYMLEEFEETKGVSRIRKLKDRQHNGQKRYKQKATQKTKN